MLSISKTDREDLEKIFYKEMINLYHKTGEIGSFPKAFLKMIITYGGLETAKKLINSSNISDGFAFLVDERRLDLTVEALSLQKKFRSLFTYKEIEIAKKRLSDMDYEYKNEENYSLPQLNPSGRDREYKFYSDELKASVIFEHLVHDKTHRWLDENILGITNGSTRGRNSANILYYLGMKANYRGIFQGKELGDVTQILETKEESYTEAIRLLKLLEDRDLNNNIKLDIEAEKAEEGQGIEGQVKYYYGKRYERDHNNRKLAIKEHGLNCYACDFDFEKVYGERGKDFIEVHHIKPLSTLTEAVKINPNTDLVPLCANCHRMVHRRKDDVLTVDKLKELIQSNEI